MQCTSPYTGGNTPTYDGIRGVGCGRCMACRINQTSEWTMRLQHELKYFEDSSFITLTYSEDFLPENAELSKRDLQLFIKRFRKFVGSKVKIKYFACGEYGDNYLRPHYHLIVLGWKPRFLRYVSNDGKRKIYSSPEVADVWKCGHNTVGVVNHDSIQYVVGYVRKKLNGEKANEFYGKRQRPFSLISKGIGERYAQENADKLNEDLAVIEKGITKTLPRYYAKKANISDIRRQANALKAFVKSCEDYESSNGMTLVDQLNQIDKNLIAKNNLRRDKL